jgi:molecular chaperone IbpA
MTVFSSLHPFTIGYDDVFKHFETLLEHQQPNYPPYNIVKTGDYTHCVEVALAGYSKAEVEVIVEDKTLTIKSSDLPGKDKPKDNVIHKGIAKRAFKRVFTLAEDVVVNDAVLKDGLLRVELERVVPEEKKPKVIKIK